MKIIRMLVETVFEIVGIGLLLYATYLINEIACLYLAGVISIAMAFLFGYRGKR